MATENIYCDTNNRIFYLSDEIGNDSVGKFNYHLLTLIESDNKEESEKKDFSRKPIKLYINSFGGSVNDMWALIDIIKNSKTPIYTYCTGYAMSAGFMIFLAGHKRYMTKHATLMYHQMHCHRNGKYQDLVEDRNEMDWVYNQMKEFVLENSEISSEVLDEIRIKKKDFYIHSDKAIDLGVVDEII